MIVVSSLFNETRKSEYSNNKGGVNAFILKCRQLCRVLWMDINLDTIVQVKLKSLQYNHFFRVNTKVNGGLGNRKVFILVEIL